MLQRCDALFPAHWNVPGGHGEPGEDAVSAAVRELREEVGLQVETSWLNFAGVSHYRPPTRSEKVSFTFCCTRWVGLPTIREPAKFSSLAWWPRTEIPSLAMPQAKEAIRLADSPLYFSTYGLGERNGQEQGREEEKSQYG